MRHLPPLLLMVIGCALWHLEMPVPGTPQVLPGLWPTDAAADRRGTLYVCDYHHSCVWVVAGWRKRRIPGPTVHPLGPGSLRIATKGDGAVYLVDALGPSAWRLLPQGSWQPTPVAVARRTLGDRDSPGSYSLVDPPGSWFLHDVYVAKSDRLGCRHVVMMGRRVAGGR